VINNDRDPMTSRSAEDAQAMHDAVAKAIAHNLTAALSVSATDPDDGQTKRLKSTVLHRATGVSRSTLQKLASGKAGPRASNPDLNTLCRIAAALHVPVSILLMGPDEWQAVLATLNGLPQAIQAADALVQTVSGTSRAEVGLKIVESLKLYPSRLPDIEPEEGDQEGQERRRSEIARSNERRRKAVLAATAVSQLGARNKNDLVPLTAVGALIGANVKFN
jgi:transcriptional regulator with XRE-family HTH domain